MRDLAVDRQAPAIFRRSRRRAALLRLLVALAAIAGLLLAALLSPHPAAARDYRGPAHPKVRQWYRQQHNALGQWCCDESDGHRYDGDYRINEDGSVTLFLATGPRTLPEYMVLKGPNLAGHPVWWFLDTGATHTDYCFAPGTLT